MAALETIGAYLDALARELRFDAALSRRICAEVEDHLLEAAEACDEREAIARFGKPRELAVQLATVSFSSASRSVASSSVLVVIAMFFLMQGRLAWYAAVHVHPALGLGAMIDRSTFWLGITAAVIAFAFGWLWRHCSLLLSSVTTVCVVAMVLTDACVALGRITLFPLWSASAFVVLASVLVEAVLTAVLVVHVRRLLSLAALLQ